MLAKCLFSGLYILYAFDGENVHGQTSQMCSSLATYRTENNSRQTIPSLRRCSKMKSFTIPSHETWTCVATDVDQAEGPCSTLVVTLTSTNISLKQLRLWRHKKGQQKTTVSGDRSMQPQNKTKVIFIYIVNLPHSFSGSF